MNLYPWFLWLHILSGVAFFFVHGTGLAIAFRLKVEKHPIAREALLGITGMTIPALGVTLLLMLITSIYLGIAAGWIKQAWWGISFLLMFGMVVWMTWHGRKVYSPIRKALGLVYMTGMGKENPAVPPASEEEIERAIAQSNPHLLLTVGFIVTAITLWLMTFKPF
jgi:hypothetical protein